MGRYDSICIAQTATQQQLPLSRLKTAALLKVYNINIVIIIE